MITKEGEWRSGGRVSRVQAAPEGSSTTTAAQQLIAIGFLERAVSVGCGSDHRTWCRLRLSAHQPTPSRVHAYALAETPPPPKTPLIVDSQRCGESSVGVIPRRVHVCN
eukprot:COSAG01_NODE_1781_length_9246_cov_99.135673_3_plen_109_part_00